jgi:glycosyltransferase involved in cell wall biosynthesis
MANKLGVRGKIIYISFDSNPYKYLYNSDCFISTSLIEGFPNVLLESLACQLPIIAADCPSGPREILSNKYRVMDKPINKLEVEEYGILIPTNDLISNLIKAMELIYNDKELREKYKAKSNDRANEFGVQHFITNFERIIQ